ncbi:hypothetical protein ADIAL_0181 [Alkalibacterium sp. AK22]|nr:hypothetical protein ADIAL_0181 [Alkalibacterium sp. AK22]
MNRLPQVKAFLFQHKKSPVGCRVKISAVSIKPTDETLTPTIIRLCKPAACFDLLKQTIILDREVY